MGASSGFKYVLPLSPLLKQLCPGEGSFPFSSTALECYTLECGIGDDYPAAGYSLISSSEHPKSTCACLDFEMYDNVKGKPVFLWVFSKPFLEGKEDVVTKSASPFPSLDDLKVSGSYSKCCSCCYWLNARRH